MTDIGFQQQLDQIQIDRLDDAISSASSAAGGHEDQKFQNKMAIRQTLITAGTVGLAKLQMLTMSQQQQQQIQSMMMMAQTVNWIGSLLLVKNPVRKRNLDKLAQQREGVKSYTAERNKKMAAYQADYMQDGDGQRATHEEFNAQATGEEKAGPTKHHAKAPVDDAKQTTHTNFNAQADDKNRAVLDTVTGEVTPDKKTANRSPAIETAIAPA